MSKHSLRGRLLLESLFDDELTNSTKLLSVQALNETIFNAFLVCDIFIRPRTSCK